MRGDPNYESREPCVEPINHPLLVVSLKETICEVFIWLGSIRVFYHFLELGLDIIKW